MTPLIAIFLMRGSPLTRFEIILILLFAGAVMLVGLCWQFLDNWKKRTRGRNWPTVSAVVEIVNVAFMKDDSPIPRFNTYAYLPYYLAILTYTYRNPEQQIGDYSRRFVNEDDAKAWANSYKGETVKVRVNPRDPTHSVLREEDL